MAEGTIISIWGEPWSWKSHLATSMVHYIEGEVVIFDLDRGLGPILSKSEFVAVKNRIKRVECPIPSSMGVDEFAPKNGNARNIFKQIASKYKAACEAPGVGGIIIDTSTIFYQIARERRLLEITEEDSKRKSLSKFEYGPINLWLAGAYFHAKNNGKVLALISHARPIYDENDNPTSELECDSWSRTQATADIEIRTVRVGNIVKLFIQKSRYHASVPHTPMKCEWESIRKVYNGEELE